MTTNDDPLVRRALFVAFEGMGVFDLTGPLKRNVTYCLRPHIVPKRLCSCAGIWRMVSYTSESTNAPAVGHSSAAQLPQPASTVRHFGDSRCSNVFETRVWRR